MPTSMCEGETKLLQALATLARGAATVLVAHRATMLPLLDTLLVLNEGRVSHYGARDDILAQINGVPKTQELARGQEAA